MHVSVRFGAITAAALACATMATAGGASAAPLKCPPAASTAPASSATAVAWQFSELGAPTPASPSTSSSWTRGSGTWSAGRAKGTICSSDSGGGNAGRDIVLGVSGPSKLSPQITRLGLPGVGIVVPVTVTASDDAACPRGSAGSVTLFASYYSVHRDSIALHFNSACADHDHVFTGAIVHVLIARNGRQVNTAGT